MDPQIWAHLKMEYLGLLHGKCVVLAIHSKLINLSGILTKSPMTDIVACKININYCVVYAFVLYTPPTLPTYAFELLLGTMSLALNELSDNFIFIFDAFNVPVFIINNTDVYK